MRFFVFVFGYCVVFDLVLCTSEVIFLSVLVFLVFVRFSYILSGLWSLHSVHLYVFLVTWHFIGFHTFMLSWSFFFLVVYFVVHYSIVAITYRAVGCLWTFSRFLWSQYFWGWFCADVVYFYGNLFHVICDCFGHFVVILRLLVYHFVCVYWFCIFDICCHLE